MAINEKKMKLQRAMKRAVQYSSKEEKKQNKRNIDLALIVSLILIARFKTIQSPNHAK